MKIMAVLLVVSLVACGILGYGLASKANELQLATNKLETTQNQLTTVNDELTNSRTELTNAESELDSTLTVLADTEDELQSAQNQLTNNENQLRETESQLSIIRGELTTIKDEKTKMLVDYSDIREQINLRLGQGQDCQQYITPDDENVAAIVLTASGVYSEDINELWGDYERLYRWVVNNIEYNSDSYLPFMPASISGDILWTKDFWRMPAETLEDEVGDCEDMALLLASLMLNYNNERFGVWVLGIRNDEKGHLAVAIPVAGDKLTIFDPAGKYYTGKDVGYLQSLDIDHAVDNWLTYWASEMPGAEIDLVFSYNFNEEFENTQEFIDWVEARN